MEQQPQHLWSHLPDLCLLVVFKYISVSDMIRSVGRVCTNWGRVQRHDLSHRAVLSIFGVSQDDENDTNEYLYNKYLEDFNHNNPYGSNFIEHVRRDENGLPWARVSKINRFNTLRVPDGVLTEPFTSPLMDILPGITHLTIYQKNNSLADTRVFRQALEQIVRLIDQYAHNLISLNVHFMTWGTVTERELYSSSAQVDALFDSINRLEALRHLTLKLNFTGLKHEPRLSLILSRLSTFTVHNFEPCSPMYHDSLHQLASTGNLRIHWTYGTSLADMMTLGPQLATKFTGASIIDVSATDYDNVRLFCARFNSWIMLDLSMLSFGALSMAKLARVLSQMPHLIHLKIYFGEIPEEQQTETQLDIVPSVRLLTLTIFPESHEDTQHLHLHRIFPNLQVLHLIYNSLQCEQCERDSYDEFQMDNNREYRERIDNCLSLARQPFRQWAKLHTVKLDAWHGLGTSSSLPQGLLTVDQL